MLDERNIASKNLAGSCGNLNDQPSISKGRNSPVPARSHQAVSQQGLSGNHTGAESVLLGEHSSVKKAAKSSGTQLRQSSAVTRQHSSLHWQRQGIRLSRTDEDLSSI